VSAARNADIAQAGAEWVAFVDDDDIWAPAKLRDQLVAVLAEPGPSGRVPAPFGSTRSSGWAGRSERRVRT